MSEALFWVAGACLVYVYAGYPVLVWAAAALRARPRPRAGILPSVSVLVSAHDEEARIDARLQNLLALDYPRHRIEILVGSDGSTDGTVARARRYPDVTVVDFPHRRGKPAVLNDLARIAHGEVLVLGDVRQRYEPDTVRALVAPLAAPDVGAVSGELMLAERDGGGAVGRGVGFYWRYEKFIRSQESRLDSTVGATGAVYAVRRELFEALPADAILDDVLLPMRVVRRGYRVLFEPAARAYDSVATTSREEFTRKVRTIAGNFQLFASERWLLSPTRNRLWAQTVSHKVLRLASPLFLLVAFAANIALVDVALYRWTLAAQVLFYAAALGGSLLGDGRRVPLLTVPYVFCLLNYATAVAFSRFLRRQQHVTWERASA
jgi:cellulose synthase/poly-beta-1,6-N-acetylglucosamine synthase-like glycosyltransferase